MMEQQDQYITIMSTDGTLTSDAGGTMAPVFTSNPASPGGGLGACAGWSSLSAVFDEYRTLAFEVEFVSVYDQLISSAVQPLCFVKDYDTSTALSSFGNADNYASQKLFTIAEYDGKVKKFVIRMNGAENAGFANTASPAALFWIKAFSTGLTTSSNVIHVFVRYLVQFRGRGV